jgi:hypothetical protein
LLHLLTSWDFVNVLIRPMIARQDGTLTEMSLLCRLCTKPQSIPSLINSGGIFYLLDRLNQGSPFVSIYTIMKNSGDVAAKTLIRSTCLSMLLSIVQTPYSQLENFASTIRTVIHSLNLLCLSNNSTEDFEDILSSLNPACSISDLDRFFSILTDLLNQYDFEKMKFGHYDVCKDVVRLIDDLFSPSFNHLHSFLKRLLLEGFFHYILKYFVFGPTDWNSRYRFPVNRLSKLLFELLL